MRARARSDFGKGRHTDPLSGSGLKDGVTLESSKKDPERSIVRTAIVHLYALILKFKFSNRNNVSIMD